MDILNSHHTIRKFKEKSVPEELIYAILESSFRGSTTGNMQLYSVIISESIEVKEKLIPLHFNQPVAKSAPVLLTFCADFHRFTKWCNFRDATPGYNNFLSFLTATIDAIIVAQNFCIAAENAALGICYLGTTTYNAKEIIDVLNLPKLVFPVTTIAVGYPDEDPSKTDRLPVESIIHKETYGDYSEEMINNFYFLKESLEDSKKFIKENRKETFAQVFTDVRYKKEDNEFFSKKILDVLAEQGFLVS